MAKSNGQNWTPLATYPNGGSSPHIISINTSNLSTQGAVVGKIKRTLELVQQKNVKITVTNKNLFVQVCKREGFDHKKFKKVINFK
ncbi:MAG: hypothetical protein WC621_00640 [Patescibacteria group bacterium]